MPAADEAFGRLAGHFAPARLARLVAERAIEIAPGLLAGVATRLVTSRDLVDAVRAGHFPAKRMRCYVNRRKLDLQLLGAAGDAPMPGELVDQLAQQGATLVFNHADRILAPLHRLAGLIGAALAQRIEVTAVLSFTDRSGLSPHHDVRNVFIVQVEGEKEWALLGPPVREGLPVRSFAGEEGAERLTTLRAGDVMFLPAGQRHYCSPSPGGSLHLGIQVHAPSGAQAAASLSEAIANDSELLRPYVAFAQQAELPALLASYRARLHALVDELDLQAILDDPRGREQPAPEVMFAQSGGNAMNTDSRVDAKIAEAREFARPILTHLRALVHRTVPGVEEAIKWGMPHFTYKGKNIAGMASFKEHCAFMIHGEGRQGAEGGGMGSAGKIALLADLPSDEELAERLRAAMGRIDRGEKEPWREAPSKPKSEIAVPQDFAAALAANPAAAQYFDGLAPSHRYEYLQWITEAKRDETRAKRIGQALEWLAEGKRRNWKYER